MTKTPPDTSFLVHCFCIKIYKVSSLSRWILRREILFTLHVFSMKRGYTVATLLMMNSLLHFLSGKLPFTMEISSASSIITGMTCCLLRRGQSITPGFQLIMLIVKRLVGSLFVTLTKKTMDKYLANQSMTSD